MPAVVRTIEIKTPPSVVWQQFSSQDALRRWLSPNLEITLELAGKYRLLGPDDETWITGVVLELVPEGRLVLSWLEEGAGWTNAGRLVIELEPIADGTRVTLTHDGFAGIGTAGWRNTKDAYERGADRHLVLQQLAAAVAS